MKDGLLKHIFGTFYMHFYIFVHLKFMYVYYAVVKIGLNIIII